MITISLLEGVRFISRCFCHIKEIANDTNEGYVVLWASPTKILKSSRKVAGSFRAYKVKSKSQVANRNHFQVSILVIFPKRDLRRKEPNSTNLW